LATAATPPETPVNATEIPNASKGLPNFMRVPPARVHGARGIPHAYGFCRGASKFCAMHHRNDFYIAKTICCDVTAEIWEKPEV